MASDERAAQGSIVTVPGAMPRGRVRNVALIVVAFVVTLGALTGGVLTLLAYDKSTSIDRSTPQVVTDQFLDASIVQRDADKLALFLCTSWPVNVAMAAARGPTDGDVTASWGDFVTTIQGNQATVVVNVQFSAVVNDVIQRLSERWTLTLVNEAGWRVCNLVTSTSLSP